MLYFAYGSNLDGDQMRERCASAQAVGIARLDGYRLAFSRRSTNWGCGVLDIVTDAGVAVWGVVYHIDDADLDVLHDSEGYHADRSRGNAYQPITVTVWRDGEPAWPLVVMTYEVVRKDAGPHRPNAAYKRLFVTGARHWGLPPAYIAQLEAVAVE